MRRHLIVGSGIAGLAAAEAIRQRDAGASVSMISEEPHDFYSRPGLAYLLRGDIPEAQLAVRTHHDLKALGLRRVTAKVLNVDTSRHEVDLGSGKLLPYDRLLLAPGALALPPSFPGADLAGIVKLDGLDDARHILQLARKGRPAVVVGGGITALELAEGLHARGMDVYYFLRGARYWADVLDETESSIIMDRLRQEGIDLRTETQVKEAVGDSGRISGIETQAGERVPCDLLAVAIGVRPRLELAQKAGLKVGKGIVVNEFLETSAPGIYAAGDAAEVADPRTGKAALDVLWPTALSQGRIAGANMAGERRAYVKDIPFNVTQLAGLRVTVIGAIGGGKNDDLLAITRGESEAWRQAPRVTVVGQRGPTDRVRLMVDDRAIVGALVMGDQTWSGPLQRLILGKADITSIREALLQPGADLLGRLSDFYAQWRLRPTRS